MGIEEKRLDRLIDEIHSGIETCVDTQLYLCALILLYSGIDGLAALESGRANVSAFKKWVEDHLLPSADLQCTANDLYAARCGVVHTFSQESKRSRKGKAKTFLYVRDDTERKQLETSIDAVGRHGTRNDATGQVVIDIQKLYWAFQKGVKSFRADVHSNPELRKKVDRNLCRIYSFVTLGPAFAVLDIKMR